MDFAQVKKRYLPTTLKDGTSIHVCTPTKAGLSLIAEYHGLLDKGLEDDKAIDRIYEIFSEILSRNKENKAIPKKDLTEYELVDCVLAFMTEYEKFVLNVLRDPN